MAGRAERHEQARSVQATTAQQEQELQLEQKQEAKVEEEEEEEAEAEVEAEEEAEAEVEAEAGHRRWGRRSALSGWRCSRAWGLMARLRRRRLSVRAGTSSVPWPCSWGELGRPCPALARGADQGTA